MATTSALGLGVPVYRNRLKTMEFNQIHALETGIAASRDIPSAVMQEASEAIRRACEKTSLVVFEAYERPILRRRDSVVKETSNRFDASGNPVGSTVTETQRPGLVEEPGYRRLVRGDEARKGNALTAVDAETLYFLATELMFNVLDTNVGSMSLWEIASVSQKAVGNVSGLKADHDGQQSAELMSMLACFESPTKLANCIEQFKKLRDMWYSEGTILFSRDSQRLKKYFEDFAAAVKLKDYKPGAEKGDPSEHLKAAVNNAPALAIALAAEIISYPLHISIGVSALTKDLMVLNARSLKVDDLPLVTSGVVGKNQDSNIALLQQKVLEFFLLSRLESFAGTVMDAAEKITPSDLFVPYVQGPGRKRFKSDESTAVAFNPEMFQNIFTKLIFAHMSLQLTLNQELHALGKAADHLTEAAELYLAVEMWNNSVLSTGTESKIQQLPETALLFLRSASGNVGDNLRAMPEHQLRSDVARVSKILGDYFLLLEEFLDIFYDRIRSFEVTDVEITSASVENAHTICRAFRRLKHDVGYRALRVYTQTGAKESGSDSGSDAADDSDSTVSLRAVRALDNPVNTTEISFVDEITMQGAKISGLGKSPGDLDAEGVSKGMINVINLARKCADGEPAYGEYEDLAAELAALSTRVHVTLDDSMTQLSWYKSCNTVRMLPPSEFKDPEAVRPLALIDSAGRRRTATGYKWHYEPTMVDACGLSDLLISWPASELENTTQEQRAAMYAERVRGWPRRRNPPTDVSFAEVRDFTESSVLMELYARNSGSLIVRYLLTKFHLAVVPSCLKIEQLRKAAMEPDYVVKPAYKLGKFISLQAKVPQEFVTDTTLDTLARNSGKLDGFFIRNKPVLEGQKKGWGIQMQLPEVEHVGASVSHVSTSEEEVE